MWTAGLALITGGFSKLLTLAARVPWWAWVAAVALFIGWRVHSGLEDRAFNAAFNKGWSQQHALLVADQKAFASTVTEYRNAAAEAARLDKANVARVAGEQATITERTIHDYQAQLATSADRYDRLRAKAAGYLSHPSSAEAAGLPDDRETTCRVIAGADCEAIPALLKAAQDNTDQLVALQAWVTRQSAVDFGNAPTAPNPIKEKP